MDPILFFVIAFVLSLMYAWGNGSNDCANSQTTVVATGALSPQTAVILGGIMTGLGLIVAWFLGSAVAKTIGKGVIGESFITEAVILGGLVGAIVWIWFATWRGIPISATHSLVGGVLGAGIAHGGFAALANNEKMVLIIIGIFLAPVLGFMFGYIVLYLLKALVYYSMKNIRHATANRFWRKAQIFSSSWLAFSHGMNDGQNAVGILALAAVAGGVTHKLSIESWMVIPVAFAIGAGTTFHGLRVIKTAKEGLASHFEPIDGFAAQIAMAFILMVKSIIGIPASTTHVAMSGILGAGGAKGFENIDTKITRHIGMAWIFTIPFASMVGGGTYYALALFNI